MSPILVGFDLLLWAAGESLNVFTHHLFDKLRRWDGELEAHVTAEALDVTLDLLSKQLDDKSVERQMSQWRQVLTFPAGYPQHFIRKEIDLTRHTLMELELYQAQRQGIPIVCFNQDQYRQQAEQDCISVDIWNVNELDQWCELRHHVNQLIRSDPHLIARYFLLLPKHSSVPEDEVFTVTDAENWSETGDSENVLADGTEQPLQPADQNQRQINGESAQRNDSDLPVRGRGTQINRMQPLDGINPGADGLHILLFLFSQYLLMQMLQNSLGDRLETKNFSTDLTALAQIWDLAEQSGLLILSEAMATPERLAAWLAAAINELTVDAAVNDQADALISEVSLPLRSIASNPNASLTPSTKNTRQPNEATLLNRVLGQNDVDLNPTNPDRFESGNDGDLAFIPDTSADRERAGSSERNQNDGQPAENLVEPQPVVPVELPVTEPIPREPRPAEPEPNPPLIIDSIPEWRIIPPIDRIDQIVDRDLIEEPSVNPNPDSLTNPEGLPISEPPVMNPPHLNLDEVPSDEGDWAEQPQNRDTPSEGNAERSDVVEPVELPVIPDSPSTEDTNDRLGQDDPTELPIELPAESPTELPTESPTELPAESPLPSEEPLGWIGLANPYGSSVLKIQAGKFVIANFGGIGRGIEPPSQVVNRVDTLQFTGAEFTAENMLLKQQGKHLVITFEHSTIPTVLLKNFALEDLDNLSTTTGAKLNGVSSLGNILFNGQSVVQDDFDVIDSDRVLDQVLRANTVTFLNPLDNNTQGRDHSNDVIDGMEGNDQLFGLSGQDKLRGGDGDDRLDGGDGNDFLLGGNGDDILIGGSENDTLNGGTGRDQFVLSPEGTAIIQDFQPYEDVIGLTGGLSASQISVQIQGENTLLLYNNQTIATLVDVKIDAGLINFVNHSGNL